MMDIDRYVVYDFTRGDARTHETRLGEAATVKQGIALAVQAGVEFYGVYPIGIVDGVEDVESDSYAALSW